MSRPTPKSPFAPGKIQEARASLEEAGFPLTEAGAAYQRLDATDPFLAYTLAAAECLAALRDPADPRRLVKCARRSADLVDRIVKWTTDSLALGPSKSPKIACKKGCHYCCYIRVTVLASEVVSIAEAIADRHSPEERSAVSTKTEQFLDRAKGLSPRERFYTPMLCPLNHEGLCTVYDVRPVSCRIHHSFSVDQCRVAFERWEDDPSVTRSAMRTVCCEAVMEAQADVLEFLGIESRFLELPEALQLALSRDNLGQAVLAGEDVLASAHVPTIGP